MSDDAAMIVVVSTVDIGLEASGPSYSVPGLCRGLHEAGVEVALHTLKPPPNTKFHFPFPLVTYHGKPSRFLPGNAPEMEHGLELACVEADVLHTNGLWMMPMVYPGRVIKRLRRNGHSPKLVVAPRGCLAPWALKRGWMKKKVFGWLLQNQVLSQADMFHATSEKEYEEIRARGYRQPVAIVPIGMDLPKLENFNAEKQRGGEAERTRKVVFFGRLHKVKGVDRLVRAWGEVARGGWELVIAGPDCGMLEELKGIVAERKLPRVSFVGEINGHAKYEFLAGADIYVLPSDTENFGITVAEALASGTPVIASQGTPWQGLERERCGCWVPIGVEPLATALKELMALDDAERAAMGERGKEWIQRDFTWKGIGEKMKAAYTWLLDKGEKPEWVRVE